MSSRGLHDEWGNHARDDDYRYADEDVDLHMNGSCWEWALAHQRRNPHLRIGQEWAWVPPDERDHPDEEWEAKHAFTHDDHWAYDVRGAFPLSEWRRWKGWDDVTLNHEPREIGGSPDWPSEDDAAHGLAARNEPRPPLPDAPRMVRDGDGSWRLAARPERRLRLEREVLRGGDPDDPWEAPTVFAYDDNHPDPAKPVGYLRMDRDDRGRHYIDMIHVDDRYTREGIGRAMWEHAGRPLHAPEAQRSPEGLAWSRAVGGGSIEARLAMPAPMPEGIQFKYHPDYPYDLHGHQRGPTAYAVKNYDQIGYVTWHPDGEVKMIDVHPDYRRHGIATALFDFAKQHEPGLHHSPHKSDLGEAWSSYEKSRSARLGMAWDEWAPQIQGGCEHGCDHDKGMMGEYWIGHPDGSGPKPGDLMPGLRGRSVLNFTHDTAPDGTPELYISGVHTDEGHRRSGVAEALMRRLHQDHPDTRINPGYMTDMGQGLKDGLTQRIPGAGDVLARLAAVNQDLIDRLNDEFHQWAGENPHKVELPGPLDHPDRGYIRDWQNIENFLQDRYPAAYKNHEMGMEEAGWILDGNKPMPYQERGGQQATPYETGPEAVARHGYDPAEIAASMLLLHNQSHPLRGDMAAGDQQRLVDIFEKRQRMQRDYERRSRTAMPWPDWTDRIEHFDDSAKDVIGPSWPSSSHTYLIRHPDARQPGGDGFHWSQDAGAHSGLAYTVLPGKDAVVVNLIHTHPNHRHDGVAEALMRRLHQDHPGHMIDPGYRTDDGKALTKGLVDRIPEARSLLPPGTFIGHRTAMGQRGPLPDNLTFRYWPDSYDGPEPPRSVLDFPAVTAHIGDDPEPVGHLSWIEGHPDDYRREMLDNADEGETLADIGMSDFGQPIGSHPDDEDYIGWPTTISNVHVNEQWRRRGIADALFDHVQQNYLPELRHSYDLTPDGHAWSRREEKRRRKRRSTAMAVLPEGHEGPAEPHFDPSEARHHDPGDDMVPPDGAVWYHVSPHELKPGTVLTPRGGDSYFEDEGFYGHPNLSSRQRWVWMEHDPAKVNDWLDMIFDSGIRGYHTHPMDWPEEDKLEDEPPLYVYRVRPHTPPQPWDSTGKEGWVAGNATVLGLHMEETGPWMDRVRQEIKPGRGRVARAPWNPAGGPLWRGMRVRWSPEELVRLHDLHDSGDHETLAHTILDRVQHGSTIGDWHMPREDGGGLGVFWSGDPGVSRAYSHHGDGHDPNTAGLFENVVVQAEGYDPADEWTPYDEDSPIDEELNDFLNEDRETDLYPGAPLGITHVHVNAPAGALSIPLTRPRRMTARLLTALDWHSHDDERQRIQFKDKIPADPTFLEPTDSTWPNPAEDWDGDEEMSEEQWWAALRHPDYDPTPRAYSYPKPPRQKIWYHVSPHEMQPGDTLIPTHKESWDNRVDGYSKYTRPGGNGFIEDEFENPLKLQPYDNSTQANNVWMSPYLYPHPRHYDEFRRHNDNLPEDMPPEERERRMRQWFSGGGHHFANWWAWRLRMPNINNGQMNIYEVRPSKHPQPWNLTYGHGWAAPSARVIRKVPREEWENSPSREDVLRGIAEMHGPLNL